VVDRFGLRYAKVVFPFVVAVAAALANSGCSDGPDGNSGGGGAGGGSSSGGSGGGVSSSSSSSSSSGMMGCGDMQTDPMNCGVCDNQCAPGQTCVAGVCTCGMATVAFADVQTIFTQRCATGTCHVGATAKAGLDLSTGLSHAELFNVASGQCGGSRMRVLPGKPDESYLVDKLLGVDMCGATSKRMPPSISLSMGDIQTISDWICGGALEN
jgi:hypothetical protein